ncbi:MAG TPA: metallophosphoesterase [Pseudomonadota bacterium]|nr:metallophosphoesterase [Pseudomonadota bacterium]
MNNNHRKSHHPSVCALVLSASLLGGCQSSTSSDQPIDMGTSPDGGIAEIPLINPSLHNTVLGRPTDSSVAISVLADAAGDKMYIEYGTQIDAAGKTITDGKMSAAVASAKGEPMVMDLTGLGKDTKYYYRVHYQAGGSGDAADNIHTFRTQRAKGKAFRFGVQGDTHPERYNNKMFHSELFSLTMQQVRNRQPDLYFTLGDDFSSEKIIQDFKSANYPATYSFTRAVDGIAPYSSYQTLKNPFQNPMLVDGKSAPQGYAAYQDLRKQYFGIMANATALMLVNGNHEQAHLANIGGIFNNAAVWAADGRLKYYPLPAPGAFYTGDQSKLTAQNGYPTIAASDGLLRDYYAFTWGDALFVTIDPYWHSPTISPDSTLFSDPEPKWGATLGDEQYQWLKKTLEGSDAKWKFVFAHHVNGNNRGGAGVVGVQEWGGEPGFSTNRPTWAKPIHQLFADTKVTIFFQGHDHMYAREKVDGVIYQEVPNPGDNSYFAYNCDAYAPASISWQGPAGYGVYDPSYNVRLPNTGYIDVTVSADNVRVDYIRTYRPVDLQSNPNRAFKGTEQNGEVAFSYSVVPQATDSRPQDVTFTCMGAAPPATWVYNP